MEKGINLKTAELQENIVKVINEAQVPAVIIKYVLKDILEKAQQLENTTIQQEKEEYEKEAEKGCQQKQQT